MNKKKILSIDEVKHIAKLANLVLTDNEIALFATQLSSVLDYINQLASLDTVSVEPTSQVTGLTNVYREDSENKSLTVNQALGSAQTEDNFFNVKAIFHEQD